MIWQNGGTTIMEQDGQLYISTSEYVEIALPLREGDREKLEAGADPIQERWPDDDGGDAHSLLMKAEEAYLRSMLDKVRNQSMNDALLKELVESGFLMETDDDNDTDEELDFILTNSLGDHWLTCICQSESDRKWVAYSNGEWLD